MPNRFIKESICRSDSINSLSWFEEVLFYRLIVVCDDFGRYDGRAAIIRGSCFPLKDIRLEQIEDALEKLAIAGMIRRYETEDGAFLQLTAWSKHQQTRAAKSKYPDPDDSAKNQSPGRSDTGLCIKNTSSETNCNQMISDDIRCARIRYSKFDIRNSNTITENACARETGQVRRFEEFWDAYPKKINELAASGEYERVLKTTKSLTEDTLIQAAKNYAETCKIEGRDDRYIKSPANWIKDSTWIDFTPENYKKLKRRHKKQGNNFNDYPHRDYDFESIKKQMFEKNE